MKSLTTICIFIRVDFFPYHQAKSFNVFVTECIVEITLRRGCSPVNLLHIFRTTFPKNTSGGLLLLEENLNHLTEIKIDLKCTTFDNFEKMLKSKETHIEIAVTIAILILRFKTSKQKMLSIKRTFS